MMSSQKAPPVFAMNVALNITSIPAQEAFLVDAPTPTSPNPRWIQAQASGVVTARTTIANSHAAPARYCEPVRPVPSIAMAHPVAMKADDIATTAAALPLSCLSLRSMSETVDELYWRCQIVPVAVSSI